MYRHPEIEGITILSNRVEMGRPVGIRDAGSWWHSDYSYRRVPANATILWSIEIPEQGGDTWFADLATAYAELPADVSERCLGQVVRQQYRWTPDRSHPESRWQLLSEDERAETPEVYHPLVRTHPETGERALFISDGLTTGIVGIDDIPERESDALLDQLYAHCNEPRFHYRHVWRTNEVVLWDNRSVMHRATTRELDADKPRTLWRINTRGSVPV
jgi:taurine dioxygenase